MPQDKDHKREEGTETEAPPPPVDSQVTGPPPPPPPPPQVCPDPPHPRPPYQNVPQYNPNLGHPFAAGSPFPAPPPPSFPPASYSCSISDQYEQVISLKAKPGESLRAFSERHSRCWGVLGDKEYDAGASSIQTLPDGSENGSLNPDSNTENSLAPSEQTQPPSTN